MSLKYKTLGICLIVTAVGALLYQVYESPKTNKLLTMQNRFLQSGFTSKGVSNRILKVQITFDEVTSNQDENTIVAHIQSPFNFKQPLNYKWKLGENVTLDEGLLNGAVDELIAGEKKTISIKVKGFSKQQNRHIAFEIRGLQNNRAIHGDALVASDMENTFENIVQNVERIKASQ